MPKKTFSTTRVADYLKRVIKCLAMNKSRDVRAWFKVWHDMSRLPKSLKEEAELLILKAMEDVNFTFQAGHQIFNEGLCKGLGRSAMFLGVHLASRAFNGSKRRSIHHRLILNSMLNQLDPNGEKDFSDSDKAIMAALEGKAYKRRKV